MPQNAMRHHHIYLHLAEEINLRCSGMIITECYSQDKHCVIMHCEAQDGSSEADIEWMMIPSEPFLLLKDNSRRANRNSADVFPDIIGRKILSCSKHPTDRIVFLQLTGAMLVGHFFGGANTSLFVLDADNRIIDYVKRSPQPIGESYMPSITYVKDFTECSNNENVFQALSKTGNCGALYAQEIIDRWNAMGLQQIDHSTIISDLNQESFEGVIRLHSAIMEESIHSHMAYVMKTNDGSIVLSCLPLRQEEEILWSGESWSEAIRRYRGIKAKEQRLTAVRNILAKELKHRRESLEKSIHHLCDEETAMKRMEEAHGIASLLLAMPYPSLRIQEEQVVLHDGDKTITITAGKGKTYAELAEYYFKKAKKTKERELEKEKLLPKYKKQLQEVIEMQVSFPELTDIKKMELMLHSLQETGRKEKTLTVDTHPYRVFRLADGYVLHVGRNAQNNDQLTGKFAKPNDVWLHARGVSGSHAVLRGHQPIPAHILEKAAEITAYYSQSRKASFVPVCYALKKYVRKPKGAGPGAVVMEREEVIMVEPRLPKGTIDS